MIMTRHSLSLSLIATLQADWAMSLYHCLVVSLSVCRQDCKLLLKYKAYFLLGYLHFFVKTEKVD